MSKSSADGPDDTRARMLGLGSRSFHKSYYPELRRRLAELQQTQTALTDSQQRFEQLVQSIDQVFWLIDLETQKLLYVSPTFERIWGFQSDRFSDNPTVWLESIVEEDRQLALDCALKNTTGRPFSVEYRTRFADGTIRWIRDRGFPVYNSSGKVYRIAGIAEDITDAKEAEQRLEHARMTAEEANAAKDRFLATLSHELRTPLTPVLLTASTLQDDTSLPEHARNQIMEMRRHIEMEARLIDDLLDLTRITAGKLDLQHSTVDLHHILELVMGICQHEIREKNLDVQVSLKARCATVCGDAARLQQVFWNLLKNAVKFTPEGGRIHIRSRNIRHNPAESESIRVEVEDTGIGMDADTLGRIFNAFQQGSRRITREFGGMGMGLSISKAIMDMHHGTITASSAGEGRGACFAVELACDQGDSTAQPSTHTGPSGSVTPGTSLRILLVEDHAATATILRTLLQRDGHAVTLARDVRSGRTCLDSQAFDLLISDIGLPDGSGTSLGPVARSHGITRLIALSGFGMEQDIQASVDSGFCCHLTKPVDFPRLRAVISELSGECPPP